MVRKEGGGFVIRSKRTNKKLSRVYKTRKQAVKRLKQIEYFKHQKG